MSPMHRHRGVVGVSRGTMAQEPDAIDVLGEWFGYVISGRLDLHKILLMVGPTRGGKGAIARVLTALIGRPMLPDRR